MEGDCLACRGTNDPLIFNVKPAVLLNFADRRSASAAREHLTAVPRAAEAAPTNGRFRSREQTSVNPSSFY